MNRFNKIFFFSFLVLLNLCFPFLSSVSEEGNTQKDAITTHIDNQFSLSVSIVHAQDDIPTKTPKPTSTPVPIPPSSDPQTTRILILFSTLIVIVIIFGILYNRHRFQ